VGMSIQLYERRETGRRVRYVPWAAKPGRLAVVEPAELVTLLSTIVVSMLINVEDQLPAHARLAREVRNVEEAVVRLARLNAAPLDEGLIQVGVLAWNSAVEAIMAGMSAGTVGRGGKA